MSQTFKIYYYDVLLETLTFPTRKDAVIYTGVRYGGQIGIRIE